MQNNLLDYLYNIVDKVPDKTAFSNGTDKLSFKELYDQCGAVASAVAERGIYKRPVVVFMKKSPAEISAFFGVIRSGNYYVPIDEEMPKIRVDLILDNVQTDLIICDESTIEIAKGFKYKCELALYSDLIKHETDSEKLKYIYDHQIDTDPIYIVFTSGSTGIPKGVVACHRSVIDYIEQLSETLGFNENTVFGNQSPLYFDACLKEVYPTLKFGATTYLIPRELFMIPVKLVEFINEHEINTICWVVSALTMISAFGTFKTVVPHTLRTIAFGSEVFPIKQYKLWKEALPEVKMTNLYGPTECTGMSCFFHVPENYDPEGPIPIGRPFKNTEILLLDDNGKLVPDGEQGEICIRGTALTLGYYNNPEKTAECFVQNPLNHVYPELIYKTGDIAKRDKDGNLIFVSRKDYQIKHMGHRIELGEIEANVSAMAGIRMNACIYDEEKGKIVLFYVGDMESAELTTELKGSLPRYMLPNRVIKVDSLPLTPNGKLDRKTLKADYKSGARA
ncbi:MAG: amino acid adenylation domain-containing protein [Lachnospiraceae bacterium]|nr:amino acid adenylation domain-containing protein [Lachnospiraceae bacterium]